MALIFPQLPIFVLSPAPAMMMVVIVVMMMVVVVMMVPWVVQQPPHIHLHLVIDWCGQVSVIDRVATVTMLFNASYPAIH